MKPSYNICTIAGSSLGRISSKDTKLKLINAWFFRKYKNNNINNITFYKFILDILEKKIELSEFTINKIKNTLEKIKNASPSKRSRETRIKLLISSKTAKPIQIPDLKYENINIYYSARRASEALSVSNSTILNILNKKSNSPFKGKYIVQKYII